MSRNQQRSKKKQNFDNVNVVVRCRPQNKREKRGKESVIVQCNTQSSSISVNTMERKSKLTKQFTFDKVFNQYATQEEVYTSVVAPVVHEVLEGFNCTVFAYGQTGTGKTHTMEGEIDHAELKGIIPRAVEHIFETLKSREETEYSVKVSFLELYNEQLEDLLVKSSSSNSSGNSMIPDPDVSAQQQLRLCVDKQKGVVVQNLENVLVNEPKDIYEQLHYALNKRKVSETKMNKQSSRSHCVFTMTIHTKESNGAGEDVLKVGKLNLVDLAGSECVGRSGATGDRKREAGNINQSLLTLGRVISALVEKRGHIPYRDSKLTRLLQESLGGRAKTTIIATISPSSEANDETLSTLSYASRAKNIQNKPQVNQRMTKRTLIKEYCVEIDRIKQELMAAREKNGVYLPKDRYDNMVQDLSTKTTQVTELEEAMERRVADLHAMQKKFNITEELLQKTKTELVNTKDELKDTTMILDDRESGYEALYDKADSTLETGKDAISDVSHLHSKVERTTTTINTNKNVTNDFILSTKKEVQNLSNTLTNANNKFMEQNNIVKNNLTAFQNETETYTANVLNDIKSLSNQFSSFCKDINKESKACNKTFTEEQDNFIKNMNDKINSLNETIENHVVEQNNFIESQNKLVQSTLNNQEEYFNNKFTPSLTTITDNLENYQQLFLSKTLNKYEDKVNNVTANMMESNDTFKNTVNEHIQEQNDNHNELMKKHMELSASERNDLMKNIQSMIETFQTKQTERFTNVINESKVCNTKTSEIANDYNTTTFNFIKEIKDDADNFVTTSKNELNKFITQQKDSIMKAKEAGNDNFNYQLTEDITKLSTDMNEYNSTTFVNFKDEFKSNMDGLNEKFNEEMESTKISFREKIVNFVEIIKTEKDTFNNVMKTMKKDTNNTTKTFKKAYDETYNGLKVMEETQQEQRTEFITKHIDTIMECINDFSSSLSDVVPTGATPIKKEYALPTPFKKMDPRNIVLANLKRITGTVILTGSGDTSIPSSPSVVNTAEKQVILNEVVDTSTGNNSESDNIVPSDVDEEVAVPPVVEKDDNNDGTKVDDVTVKVEDSNIKESEIKEAVTVEAGKEEANDEESNNKSKKKVKKTDENDIPSPSYQELLSNNSKKKRNAKNNTKKTRKMVSSRNSNGSNSGRNSNGRSSKLRAPSTKSGIPQRTNSSSSILSDKSNH